MTSVIVLQRKCQQVWKHGWRFVRFFVFWHDTSKNVKT